LGSSYLHGYLWKIAGFALSASVKLCLAVHRMFALKNKRTKARNFAKRGRRNQRKKCVINPFANSSAMTVLKTMYNGNFNSTLVTAMGRYFVAHPAYGINGGSASQTFYNNTLISDAASAYGQFNRFIIRRWKMIFRLQNQEAFPVIFTILPVPYLSATTFSTSNYALNISQMKGARTALAGAVTLPNSIRTLSVDIDTSQLEGISRSGMEQTGYWAQGSTVGSLYQLCYLQVWSISGTNFTTAGVDVMVNSEYYVDAIGTSVTTKY